MSPPPAADAMVGFESSQYSVRENEGVVQVCAVVQHPEVNCVINFPFNILLSVSDGSAGIDIHVFI